MAGEDTVVVYHDTFRDQWRWRRVNPAGEVLAVGAAGYPEVGDCQRVAIRVNAKPFIYTLKAEHDTHIDTSGRVTDDRQPPA